MKTIYISSLFLLVVLFVASAAIASDCEIEIWGPTFPYYVPPDIGWFCAEISNLTGSDLYVCGRQYLLYTDDSVPCGGSACDSDLEIDPGPFYLYLAPYESKIVYVELEDFCDYTCARHLVYVYERDYRGRCDYDGDEYLCTYDSGCLEIECPW